MKSEAARIRRVFDAAQKITIDALVRHREISAVEAKKIVEHDHREILSARRRYQSMTRIYRRLVESLRNRNMMPGVIGELDVLAGALCHFSPKRVFKKYGEDHTRLLHALVAAKPGLSRKRLRRRSLWKIFAEGCLGGAKFLTRFQSANYFHRYVANWTRHPDMVAALPLFLSDAGIKGLGPALAADFLKETGMTSMAKPDTWTRRLLAIGGLISSEEVPNSEVIRAFHDASEVLGPKYPPVVLDKILWQLGSGKFAAYKVPGKDKYNRVPGRNRRVREFRAQLRSK